MCYTYFDDVKADHWASGYITAAVSNSIINGMGNGAFAPEANVTYAQAMKMLVCSAGFKQWSDDKGGWPMGYMYRGNKIEIGEGVNDISDTAQITRGQASQMLTNFLESPLCVDTGEYSYDAFGNSYVKFQMMDGTGESFRSLLTDKDIYTADGYMTEDDKFVITKARNFDGSNYTEDSKQTIDIKTAYGKSEAEKQAKAFIKRDEDNSYELIFMY